MAIHQVLADNTISISELKKNPMSVVNDTDGFPVAVLNHNQPAFYCIPADAYEMLLDKLEDVELADLVRKRRNSKEFEIDISDL
ncbi:type II toxin-antitoxin system Phd/YefM family antitoxin [Photobacterium damselae]|nr:type II toxin-antitoxin system Phd/YefM family antitoxin [Photobacterium damselae]NVH47225.1 type II toxin-antitoxin system Phd/YefM family antitoxin [Photobacterium damselae subsp. damselae]BDR34510.1 plasmid stabilization protein [Photobacterium damselae subsp. damselae]